MKTLLERPLTLRIRQRRRDEIPDDRRLRHHKEERQWTEREKSRLPNILKTIPAYLTNLETLGIERDSSNGAWNFTAYAALPLLHKRGSMRVDQLSALSSMYCRHVDAKRNWKEESTALRYPDCCRCGDEFDISENEKDSWYWHTGMLSRAI